MSRKRHQCSFDGCDSEQEFEVRMRVWTTGHPSIEFECPTSLKMCAAHRTKAAEYLLNEVNRAHFTKVLLDQALPPPNWESARIEFVPMPQALPVIVNTTRVITQCDFGDQDARCVLPAKYQVAVRVFRFGSKTAHADMLTSICTCLKHKPILKLEHVLTPENKSTFLGMLTRRGFPLPDFKRSELSFVDMVEGRKADPAEFERRGAHGV